MSKINARGLEIIKHQLKDGSPEAIAHAERYADAMLSGTGERAAKELRAIFAQLGVTPRR